MTQLLSVRVDTRLLEAVDAAGRAEQRGRSDVVREALELWLEQRRVRDRVRRHGQGYARKPVDAAEFAPVLGAQRWPT